jgi:hypothetical protein
MAHFPFFVYGAQSMFLPRRYIMNARRRLVVAAILASCLMTQGSSAEACGRLWRRCLARRTYPCDHTESNSPGVALKWKFEAGKVFYQEMTTGSEQTMQIQSHTVNNKQIQTFIYSYTPKGRNGDGNWLILQRIEALKMDFTIGGSRIIYDSTKGWESGSFLDIFLAGDFFKALVGCEFEIVVDRNGHPLEVKGTTALLEKIGNSSPRAAEVVKIMMNDDVFKETAFLALGVLPDHSVRVGTAWESPTFKLEMGPIGRFDLKYNYTYDGKGKDKGTENFDKIRVNTAAKYNEPGKNVGGLPFKVNKTELRPTTFSGNIYFDNIGGRMERLELEMNMKGKMSIEIAGLITPIDLNQTYKTTIKNLDKNPVERAKKP